MKKLKDLIYDYNDILLAILIIIVAGAVIFWKVSDIMAYPAFAKAQQAAQQKEQGINIDDMDLDPIPVDQNVNPGTDEIGGTEGEQTPAVTPEPQPQVNPQPVVDKKFEVKSGDYFSTAAKNLKDAGLIDDSQAFIQKVKDLGLESKLQIGIFTIPAGADYEQIAHILTKTN